MHIIYIRPKWIQFFAAPNYEELNESGLLLDAAM